MKYHLCKMSRMYDGHPYSGPANDDKPAEYNTLEEAIAAKKRLTDRNPVGFDIYDAETREWIDIRRIV